MRYTTKFLAAVLVLAICLGLVSCAFFSQLFQKGDDIANTGSALITSEETTPEETTPEETTPEVTFPEETTPEETTPIVTEPDFSNPPDPDGTKRYWRAKFPQKGRRYDSNRAPSRQKYDTATVSNPKIQNRNALRLGSCADL